MKRHILWASFMASATLFGFNACDDMLDISPVSSITDANYWKTADQFDAFYNGIYSQFRGLSANLYLMGEPRADFFTGETAWGGESANAELPMNDLKPTNAVIGNYAGAYSVINQINLLIYNAENSNLVTAEQKAKYLSEAYGIRAYIYFQLYKTWGGVIVKTDPTIGIDISNLDRTQDSPEAVIDQILSDITASEQYFSTSTAKDCSYWSIGATNMLKGEILLWKGDYSGALQALQSVTNSGKYDLLEDFSDVFNYKTKKNKEIIFAFPTSIIAGSNEYATMGGGIRSWFTPQSQFTGMFYSDPECTNVFKNLVLETSGQKYPISELNGLIRYDFHKDMYLDENVFRDGDLRRDKTFVPLYGIDSKQQPYFAGLIQHKFNGVMEDGKSERTWADDYPVYRYADCLLLQAFAKAKLNQSPAAEINAVRKRAYGENWDESKYGYGNDNVQSSYVDADNVGAVEAVLKERCREFILEGKRWYDLRLAGDSYVYKHSRCQNGRILWPIDTNTLTNNPALKQTDGYTH